MGWYEPTDELGSDVALGEIRAADVIETRSRAAKLERARSASRRLTLLTGRAVQDIGIGKSHVEITWLSLVISERGRFSGGDTA
jgi:hypothetical protein